MKEGGSSRGAKKKEKTTLARTNAGHLWRTLKELKFMAFNYNEQTGKKGEGRVKKSVTWRKG